MGGAIPGLVVLAYIRKQTEQAIGNKSVSSTPSWLLYQLLPLGSYLARVTAFTDFDNEVLLYAPVSEISPFLSNLLLAMGFRHSNSNLN